MKDCKSRLSKLLSREVKNIIGMWDLEIFIIMDDVVFIASWFCHFSVHNFAYLLIILDKLRSSISAKFLYSYNQNCNGSFSEMNWMTERIG